MILPLRLFLTPLVLVSLARAGINEELATLFHAQHVAALAPAKETRIEELDPWSGAKTFGLRFDLGRAVPLDENSFKSALENSKIENWTFGMAAPWSPGPRSSWVALDDSGEPFLALSVSADQPSLVTIRQVIGFSEGVATFGRTRHYFFRCELQSEEIAKFLRETRKSPPTGKFVPRPDKPPADGQPAAPSELEADRESRPGSKESPR